MQQNTSEKPLATVRGMLIEQNFELRGPGKDGSAVRHSTLVRYGTPQFLLRSAVRWYGTPFFYGTGTLRWYGTLFL